MDVPHPDRVPEWLKAEMAARNLTIMDLARLTKVSRNQISRIRAGSGGVRSTTLSRLMTALESVERVA